MYHVVASSFLMRRSGVVAANMGRMLHLHNDCLLNAAMQQAHNQF
jgi:hypothetical protein